MTARGPLYGGVLCVALTLAGEAAAQPEQPRISPDAKAVFGAITAHSLVTKGLALLEADDANHAMGFPKIAFSEGSNDANLPVSLGIPAIRAASGGRSGGTHSLGEWYQPERSYAGPQAWFLATLGLVGIEGVSRPLLPRR